MKIFCLILFGLLSTVCCAQIVERFNDGQFTSEPQWSGNSSHFVVNSAQQLQLNNTAAGTSYLSTPFAASSLAGFEWEVYVRQSFSSSGSNYGRIYLVSNQSMLSGPLNGYYLQLGEAGSNDAVELFRQAGTAHTSVCRATNAMIAGSFSIRIRVARSHAGQWTLYIDYSGGTSFVQEAQGTDTTFGTASFFGVYCVYTAANANRFFFDDLIAGPPLGDIVPPTLNGVTVASQSELQLGFSESIDPASLSVLNFEVNKGLGRPLYAELLPDQKTVRLTFYAPFVNGRQYELSVAGVRDPAQNEMVPVMSSFRHFVPHPAEHGDIVFNELFTDPSPSVGLPAHEFVELYNRSQKAFNLSGWRLRDLTSTATFPAIFILPGEYLIVTAASALQSYERYGTTLALSEMPTLNNTSDALILKDPSGLTIDSVRYSLGWFHDEDKQLGGYTLERLSPDLGSNQALHWTASTDSLGGTPGKPNSVLGRNPDSIPPAIDSLIVVDQTRLRLVFNEPMDTASVKVISAYHNDQGLMPTDVFLIDRKSVMIAFADAFPNGTERTLVVSGVKDLAGNTMYGRSIAFMYFVSGPVTQGAIAINEIMSDPAPVVQLPEAEFIEIVNTTSVPYTLSGWTLSDGTSTCQLPGEIIRAGEFMILTSRSNAAKFSDFGRAVGVLGFPSLNNAGEPIVIRAPDGKVVDSTSYDVRWIGDAAKRDGGWTLERLRYNFSSTASINWRVSIDERGGTPGAPNSQFGRNPDDQAPRVMSAVVQNPGLILLHFNEPVATDGGMSVTVDSVRVQRIEWRGATEVACILAKDLDNGRTYKLTLAGVQDTARNVMPDTELSVRYFMPSDVRRKDVVISEIMPDPSPAVALPEVEYIELYNRSANPVQLSGWRLVDQGGVALLPDRIILPGDYLVLASSTANVPLSMRGRWLQVKDFPSLNNEGEYLMLTTPGEQWIDSVNFSRAMFGRSERANGGWSLELIDPENLCADEDNWAVAEDESGGTPGKLNSVNASKPDITGPRLTAVNVQSSRTLLLTFNEKLDQSLTAEYFSLAPASALLTARFVDPSLRKVLVTSGEDLKLSTPYQLQVSGLRDCAGNMVQPEYASLKFTLPEDPLDGEVVINEILFNPRPGGVDFLEIYNRGSRYVDLSGWKIARLDGEFAAGETRSLGTNEILAPMTYRVFTENRVRLLSDYPRAVGDNVAEVRLPSMPDDHATIAVVDAKGRFIDSLSYDENMHSRLIRDEDGVSLERISMTAPSLDPSNWTSAAESAGYATPGFLNSSSREGFGEAGEGVSVYPEVISLTGTDNFAMIVYRFDNPGSHITCSIFDQQGHLIKELANNMSVGFEGFLRWDGDRDDGSRARPGYYIVLFDCFNMDGHTRSFRKRIVIAPR